MILSRSSLERPVLTSTSTPRALKMSMAAGESWSEMSTRGAMGGLLSILGRGSAPGARFVCHPGRSEAESRDPGTDARTVALGPGSALRAVRDDVRIGSGGLQQ